MQIRKMNLQDIPVWLSLSNEYDKYVLELVPDLTEWYEGGEKSISFEDYMKAKIRQGEAFMAAGQDDSECFGIIAISKANNRITFFAVSHGCDYFSVGETLINHVLNLLNLSDDISINIIRSDAAQIQSEYKLFGKFNFVYSSDSVENGVPVSVMIRKPQFAV